MKLKRKKPRTDIDPLIGRLFCSCNSGSIVYKINVNNENYNFYKITWNSITAKSISKSYSKKYVLKSLKEGVWKLI